MPPRRPRNPRYLRNPRNLRLLIASMLLTSVAAVAASWFVIPRLMQWSTLNNLASADTAERQRALNYVLRKAPIDPAVLDGALSRTPQLDDSQFLMLSYVLDRAGLWKRLVIPDDDWLRWLTLAVHSNDTQTRTLASQRLADLTDLADDSRVLDALRRLGQDDDADARYNALAASAELSSAARDRAPYEKIIIAAAGDQQPIIARKAWLYVGLLNLQAQPFHGPGLPPDISRSPPEVAQAIVWASRIDLRNDPDAPEALRLVSRYALEPESPDPRPLPDDLSPLFDSEIPAVRDIAAVITADRRSPDDVKTIAGELLKSFNNRERMTGAMLCGLAGVRPTASTRNGAGEVDLLDYVARYPDYELQQVVRLAQWMLAPPSPPLPRGGVAPGNSLDTSGEASGGTSGGAATAVGLLSRGDLPQSTILLAMLARSRPEALDYLLVPRGEPDDDYLVRLLFVQEWWRVLRNYLPADAPRLWLDAPPALKHFQLELIREWWLLNRHQPGVIRRRPPPPESAAPATPGTPPRPSGSGAGTAR